MMNLLLLIMKKNQKIIFFSTIWLGIIVLLNVLIFWFKTPKWYSEDTTKEWFINNLTNNFALALNNNRSRQGLIEAYCAATSEAAGFIDPSAPGLYYDPKQSLFVTLLCTHSDQPATTKDFIKSFDREDKKIDGCERDGDMTSCDFATFLPELFAIVMNDLSKAKLAQLYTYQQWSVDEAIKAFSDTYFWPGESICGSKNVTYLGASQWSEKEAPCLHPQTRGILAQFITQAGQLVEQTTYIDANKLLTAQDSVCSETSKEFLVCAFSNSNLNTNAWESFHNTLYNELLFYKLFSTFVMNQLYYPDYQAFRIYSYETEKADQEIARLRQEISLSEEATMFMEKTLQNMQTAFPMHIWLLAYYEDVIAFRKALIRIYTPIDQLYYKLRNVQQKQ